MDPERWDRIRELFHAAIDRPVGSRRQFLDANCEDAAIRAEVESLLSSANNSLDALDRPAFEQARGPLRLDVSSKSGAPLGVGDTVGSYQIHGLLGVGGMGEVYRARDLKLKREVALKVLPPAFSADPERIARFQREAEVLASLNHPNIAQIYGVEDRALVMELVEGETLAGPLPVQKALIYARQIAEALEYAHEHGVVHRDLKPSNVKITPRGAVKVLDFGLAKAPEKNYPEGDPSRSPTVTFTVTHSGIILGTAAYMSPEQASAQPVDKRTDIWSFGVVLWEMLTGKRLFKAESVAHTLADVLRAEIDFNQLPADTPASIRDLLVRCLDRDVTSRLRDLGEARVAIQKYLADPASASNAAAALPPKSAVREFAASRRARIWIAAVAAVLAVGIVAAVLSFSRAQEAIGNPQRWRQITNFPDAATSPALSPDGRILAFARGDGWFLGHNEIYIKLLPDGTPLQLTHDGVQKMNPAFSPDGSRIAYMVRGFNTWVVPVLGGGAPHLMLLNAEGLSWIDSARVLFSENHGGGMGLETAREDRSSQREFYLPKPFGMAHFSSIAPDRKQILVVEMKGGPGPWQPCRLVPFDGSSRGRQVGPADSQCTAVGWSPNGKWMYFTAIHGSASHIWRQRVDRNIPEQITFGPSEEQGLAVAPDGQSLYTSVGLSNSSIWVHDATGDRQFYDTPGDQQLYAQANPLNPLFSPDGARVYFVSGGDLRSVELETQYAQRPFVGTAIATVSFSHDGKSVAYTMPDKTVWLADLQHRFPPRKIPIQGVSAVQLGASGRVYFNALENGQKYFFSMNPDGTERQKVLPYPIPNGSDDLQISPDERWVMDTNFRGPSIGVEAFRVDGGEPVKLCRQCNPKWSADGKSFVVTFKAAAGYKGVTVAVPLQEGAMLPSIPPEGFRTAEDMAKLPGAVVIPFEFADVSPNLTSYAYTRASHQQNIYQIPLR